MIDFHFGQFLASWKNSPRDEDEPGQRCLYSQSLDGVSWTPTDGTNILFPNMSTTALNVSLFCEPAAHINGRVYSAASPDQFCLWPVQWPKLTLMRQVYPGIGKFGPIFWMTNDIPKGYETATALNGIVTLNKMDPQTIADIGTLADHSRLPCDFNGTTKCEACLNGCQDWAEALNVTGIENEESHYSIPGSNPQVDILLYRSRLHPEWYKINHLYASVRRTPTGNWTIPVPTNITDDVANFNLGKLPDGRVYLLSNAYTDPYLGEIRDPLYISTSVDGWHFNQTVVLTSCTFDVYSNPPDQSDGCWMRRQGGSKESGVQYPQGLPISDARFRGYWAIYSLNKEDIWITYAPFNF